MEQIMIWVTVFGIIVIPLLGWIFNTLITKKIDKMEDSRDNDKKLFFQRLDEDRKNVEDHYVRRDLYEQAIAFYNEKNDEKFKSLLAVMTTQFNSVEEKIDDLKKVLDKLVAGK